MKRLLILHAGQHAGGITCQLADAAKRAAQQQSPAVESVLLPALQAGVDDLLAAQALLLLTPEKFGYMAGALKDFFDRTFYPAQGRVSGLPYALVVIAGNDGQGAISAVERIARGYPLKAIAEPLLIKGAPSAQDIEQVSTLAAAMVEGLLNGIF